MSKSPVAIIILDGYGKRDETVGNAVAQANTPNFDRYWETFPHSTLKAIRFRCGTTRGPNGELRSWTY